MLILGQLTQGAPLELGGQVCVCVHGNLSASVTHTHTKVCNCVCLCIFVCQDVCVSTEVREIIASEPGGECRQAQ